MEIAEPRIPLRKNSAVTAPKRAGAEKSTFVSGLVVAEKSECWARYVRYGGALRSLTLRGPA